MDLLKGLLSLVLLLFLIPAARAQGPVSWEAVASRSTEGNFTLQVTGSMADGWHVYADTDSTLGLEGIVLHIEQEGVQAGALQHLQEKTLLPDPLFDGSLLQVYRKKAVLRQKLVFREQVPASLQVTLTAFASNGTEFIPLSETLELKLEGGVAQATDPAVQLKLGAVDLENPAAACGYEQEARGSAWLVFFLGFMGGLLALLTPCVFPMVPLTVTFFTGRQQGKRQSIRHGLLFGLCILLIYLLCSLPFHILDSVEPELLNSLSTNVWVNLLFFLVFLLFALSFFGLFEITLPGSLTNKVDSKSHLKSLGGIFFMALTLALVSFSCTGPILGALLVGSISSDSGAWQLTAGMAGFGVALALPFSLFAMFPGWMQHLPKSGGWLEMVKKTLAFVELGLAFKFLSNADLVAQWGLLKREVFIGIWILTAIGLALYLFGFLRLSHSPGKQEIGMGRKLVGLLALAFALYMAPGLSNTSQASLRLLSGFPPPLSYSIYGKKVPEPRQQQSAWIEPQAVNDYETAVKLAKAQGKPLLVDFTGWACVNCRKMEEQVWSDPKVASLIRDNFILVSLYVDNREQLPVAERFTYTGVNGVKKEINTVGEKWATFQAINFGQVTQPLYTLLTPEGKLLNHPIGYTPDEEAYSSWLQCGLAAYGKITEN